MLLPRLALVLLAVFSAVAAHAETSDLFPVVKNDGEIDFYRMIPVHRDPAHAGVVDARLAQIQLLRSLPSSYTIPDSALPPVRDQGSRGTCAYFATLGLVESYYMAKSTNYKNLELSVECLTDLRDWMFDDPSYSGDDKPTQRPDPKGDDPSSVALTITRNGVPLSAQYGPTECRYSASSNRTLSLDDYLATFTGASASFAFAKGIPLDLNTAPTIDSIRSLIANNIPVEIGILVYNDDFASPLWKYDPINDTDQTLAGGHAIMLTGYSTSPSGETIFRFKNSWGLTWGLRGWGQIQDQRIVSGWKYSKTLDFTLSMHE